MNTLTTRLLICEPLQTFGCYMFAEKLCVSPKNLCKSVQFFKVVISLTLCISV